MADTDSMPTLSDTAEQLISAAQAIVNEHGDGTRHTVGAALLAVDGTIYAGVNVFAQGGGACAELVVLGMAISYGVHDFTKIVAVGNNGRGVIGPCGVCRQLLFDYAPTIEVIMPSPDGPAELPVADLLPLAQRSWFAAS